MCIRDRKYIETGNIPAPMGNRYAAVSPYDSFTCKGGKVIIAAGNQKLYEKLCNEVLERPDMITDPRFVDMPGLSLIHISECFGQFHPQRQSRSPDSPRPDGQPPPHLCGGCGNHRRDRHPVIFQHLFHVLY